MNESLLPRILTGPRPACLVLGDGAVFHGFADGPEVEAEGEVVFNTSMTGYQEMLTDPSYHGQILVLTTIHVGNTGVNADDDESDRVWARGLIVPDLAALSSNWRARGGLPGRLAAQGVPVAWGFDTRALVLHLRAHGALPGILACGDHALGPLRLRAAAARGTDGCDLTRDVACREITRWTSGPWSLAGRENPEPGARSLEPGLAEAHAGEGRRVGGEASLPGGVRGKPEAWSLKPGWAGVPRVVVLDCGAKRSILRRLVGAGAEVLVAPPGTSASDVLALRPDGVVVSNGPGDPGAVATVPDAIRGLLGRVPLLGICLGHQLLARALGGRTFKLPFGHHGGNHPVRDEASGSVWITSQNHNYAVDASSLPECARVSMVNLTDGSVEGLVAEGLDAEGIQFHPEAGPGPHDALGVFARFALRCSSRR